MIPVGKSVEAGIKILNSTDMEGYVRLIFGSHYIAKEVYSKF